MNCAYNGKRDDCTRRNIVSVRSLWVELSVSHVLGFLTYHCSGIFWASGCLGAALYFRLLVALAFVLSHACGLNFFWSCVITLWQQLSCCTKGLNPSITSFSSCWAMFTTFGCLYSLCNIVWRDLVSYHLDTGSNGGCISMEYRDGIIWGLSACCFDIHTILCCLPTPKWPIPHPDAGEWQVYWVAVCTSQFESYPSFIVFQLGIVAFCFSPYIQDIIAFVFKDIPDIVLKFFHLVTNNPHDSVSSMVADIGDLICVTHASDPGFGTSEEDFIQALTTLLLLYPNVFSLTKTSLGLGRGWYMVVDSVQQWITVFWWCLICCSLPNDVWFSN